MSVYRVQQMVFSISIMLFVLMGCQSNPSHNQPPNPPAQPAYPAYSLTAYNREEGIYFSLKEWVQNAGGSWTYDEENGILAIDTMGSHWEMMQHAPALSKDGVFQPFEKSFIREANDIFLPVEFLQKAVKGTSHVNQDTISVQLNQEDIDSQDMDQPVDRKLPSEQEWLQIFSGIVPPFEGAHLSPRPSHWPGAERAYRNGIHHGIDWYGDFIGVTVKKGTPVVAMMDGTVVRADHDYIELNQDEREHLLEICKSKETTPAYILDELRGRSVWIQTNQGIAIVYGHLSGIPDTIKPGVQVKQGDIIGYAGNSGTSDGVLGNAQGVHAHTEFLWYGKPLLDVIGKDQTIELLKNIFPTQKNSQL